MNCTRIHKYLAAWIDGELKIPVVQEVETHLSSCTACQKERNSLLAVKQLLQSEPLSVQASADFEVRFWHKAYAREKMPWGRKILEALDSFLPAPNFAVISAMILIALMIGGAGGVVSAMTPSKIHAGAGKINAMGLSGTQEVNGVPSMSLSANYSKMLDRKEVHS